MKTVLLPEAPGYRAGGLWGEQGGGREGGGGAPLPHHTGMCSGLLSGQGQAPVLRAVHKEHFLKET